MLFKGFLIRMDGSGHCVLMAANITKGGTTRHYTQSHTEVVLPKMSKPESDLSLQSKFQVLESTKDREMWNWNIAMQLANTDNEKPFLQWIKCKEKIERERKREMAGESMD